jgi:Ser/Thr protein kinase RdoA (MazF antagonist)
VYRTTHPLEELSARLADGSELRLLVKDLRPELRESAARERAVYARILARADVGTPHFFGSDGSRLVFEKVAGTELWQVAEVETWATVARWLARLHDRLTPFAEDGCLVRYDGDYYRRSFARARDAVPALGRLAPRYDEVVERLVALPRTVVHGELYPSNVLVTRDRVCVVDWESAASGPGLIDLAALVTGWPDGERRTIVEAYGAVDADVLDCCRLALAVRWLGWSPGWRPPPEHAHDWLGEAFALAARVMH